MGRARTWMLCAVVAWAAAGTAFPRPVRCDEPAVVEGKRARVASTLSRASARRAADLLDAALETIEADLPWRLPPDERLVVRLYATSEEYAEAVRRAGAPELADSFSATAYSTHESHVLVQPRGEAAYLDLVGGLPEYTRSLIAHEAVHQVAYRANAPAHRWWPDWYAEGMADHLARKTLAAAAGKGAPAAVLLDDRSHLVREALERGRGFRLERLLHASRDGSLVVRSLYAHWASFYALLAEDPARLRTLHQRLAALGEPEEPPKGQRDRRRAAVENQYAEALAKVYGPLEALEARWKERVRAQTPGWFEGLRSSERQGDEYVCASFPQSAAYALRVEPAPASRFSLSLEWNLLDVGSRQADIYLGFEDRDAPRFLKIAFRAEGTATLLAFSDGAWQDRYRYNAAVPPGFVAEGAWHETRIVADATKIVVDLDGKRVIEAAVPGGFEVLGRPFGIGAYEGVARFRAIEVAPDPK